jgi:crotonobetainyl-CoA:carnitine CoA-transferase CaiB-like acyl-CoA transferase
VLKSKSYKNGGPITLVRSKNMFSHYNLIFFEYKAELKSQRAEYWATRTEGNSNMWQAIQSAAEAVLANDLALANVILEVSHISVAFLPRSP